jgi:hypothetical protein
VKLKVWVLKSNGNVVMKLCIDIFNKHKCLFSKTEDRKVKWVISGSWYQWEGEA